VLTSSVTVLTSSVIVRLLMLQTLTNNVSCLMIVLSNIQCNSVFKLFLGLDFLFQSRVVDRSGRRGCKI